MEIQGLLQSAGFTGLRTETLELEPPVVCVIGSNGDRDPIDSRP
jgi:hypothetical protein